MEPSSASPSTLNCASVSRGSRSTPTCGNSGGATAHRRGPIQRWTYNRHWVHLTGDADYALRFFQAYVGGSALPDFAPLLANAGLTLRKANPDRGWIGGEAMTAGGPAVTLSQPPATGTPLFLAGIDRGDRIVGLGRITITSIADWQSAVTRLKPGEAVEIRYSQRGRDHIGTITPLADPKLEIVRSETLGHPLTARQREFRTAWLGGN